MVNGCGDIALFGLPGGCESLADRSPPPVAAGRSRLRARDRPRRRNLRLLRTGAASRRSARREDALRDSIGDRDRAVPGDVRCPGHRARGGGQQGPEIAPSLVGYEAYIVRSDGSEHATDGIVFASLDESLPVAARLLELCQSPT